MSDLNRLRIVSPQDQFKRRALTALGISVGADILDYIAAPLFAVPLLGDTFDAITMALLYNITKSKFSAALNMIEFVPVIGDLLPVYTMSTLSWIMREAVSIYFKGPLRNIDKTSSLVTRQIRSHAGRFQH